MVEKNCYICEYFELQGDSYHSIEHCKFHDYYQKSATEHLETCVDWKQRTRFSGLYKVIGILKGVL